MTATLANRLNRRNVPTLARTTKIDATVGCSTLHEYKVKFERYLFDDGRNLFATIAVTVFTIMVRCIGHLPLAIGKIA